MKMKKTVLDDNAAIYQRKRDRTERQKWSELNKEQRKQYFADYYLGKTMIVIVVVFCAVFLLWHFLKPREEILLYVAVIDEALDEKKAAQMTKELNRLYGADGKRRKVMLDDSFYMKDGALEKLEVYLHSGQIDVIIADEKTWREFAGYGFLEDVEEVDENGKYRDSYCYAPGYRENEEISFDDYETGEGKIKAYGVDISESSLFADMSAYQKNPVFAAVQGCGNQEKILPFLDFLMKNEEILQN